MSYLRFAVLASAGMLCLLSLPAALAQVPRVVPFQGVLKTSAGAPVTNTSQAVTITLYDAAMGGNALYTESQTVNAANGLFSTTIGKGDQAAFSALPFTAPYWVGVSAGGDAEMVPRLPLLSVPYAITAATVPAGSITSDRLADGAVTSAKLESDLQQTLSGLHSGPALFAGYFWSFDGAGYDIALGDGFAAVVSQTPNTLRLYGIGNPAVPSSRAFVALADGPSGVAASGNFVYVSEGKALQVYDATNPSALTAGVQVTLPDTVDKMFAANGQLYVLTYQTLAIYSLADPAHPAFSGSVNVGKWLRDGQVRNGYAYLVSKFSAPDELISCDVSNPASPQVTGRVVLQDTTNGIAVLGDWAYVSESLSNRIAAVNIANPAALYRASVWTDDANAPMALATDGSYVYVANYANGTLWAMEPAGGGALKMDGSAPTAPNPTAVVAASGVAYISAQGRRQIQAFPFVNVPQTRGDLSVQGNLSVVSNRQFPLLVQTLPGQHGIAHTDGNVVLSTFVDARGGFLGTVTNHPLSFYTNDGPPQVMLDTLGDLGVGTSTPAARLHITGGPTWTSNFWTKSLALDSASAIELGHFANGSRWGLGATEGSFYLFTTPSEDTNDPATYRLAINGVNGYVGINEGNPQYTLDVAGSLRCFGFTNSSDVRFKRDIAPLSDALSTVMGLQGVEFNWRTSEFPRLQLPTGRQVGFIAQDVEQVLPEVVSTDAEGYKSVAYQNIVPVLVEGMKQQQKEIAALRAEAARVKAARVDDLEMRLMRLEQRSQRKQAVAR